MAYWYVNFGNGSTTGYYAVPIWTTGAKTVGQFRRQSTTPAVGNERCFVCIIAGTSGATQPAWSPAKGAKTVDGTVTWMECTGQPGTCGSLTNTQTWSSILTTPILGTMIKGTATATTTLFICTTSGAIGGAEPTWNATTGATTTDGSAVWTSLGLASTFTAFQNPFARLNTCTNSFMANNDIILVGDNHAETSAAVMTLNLITTFCHVYCVDRTVATPGVGDTKTTATITTTGNFGIAIAGDGYIYGISFYCGTGANASSITIQYGSDGANLIMEACNLVIINTNGGNVTLGANNANNGFVTLISCSMRFANAASKLLLVNVVLEWRNSIAILAGGTLPTVLIDASTYTSGIIVAEGVDFSGMTAGTLIDAAANGGRISLIKCKLGAATPVATLITGNWEIELINCDTGTAYYRNERWNSCGQSLTETTVVRSGGASDGVTPLAWKLISSAFSDWGIPFTCFPISLYNTAVGTLITATIEIINDGLTLDNKDIWIEVSYFGSAANPLRSFANNGLVNGLATPSNLPASTASWVTSGLASPIKQKLVISFTPQQAGFVLFRIKLATINTTVYVDPKVTLS